MEISILISEAVMRVECGVYNGNFHSCGDAVMRVECTVYNGNFHSDF